MRSLRADETALSEIVGALMLILIVSAAATSLAMFVQSQQKEMQAHEALAQEARLERLEITRVAPLGTNGAWDEMTFTIRSHTTLPTWVWNMALNGHTIEEYGLGRFDRETKDWTSETHTHEDELRLENREQIRLTIEIPAGLFGAPEILQTDAILLELATARGNHYEGLFVPPTAVAIIETQPTEIILDATLSDHPGDNARIVKWEWFVDDVLHGTGRVLRMSYDCDTSYEIRLVVTDNHGLSATDEHEFHQVCPP